MDRRRAIGLVVALVVGHFAAWIVAVLVGLSSDSVTATVVLRTLLGLAMVVMLTRIVMRGAYDDATVTTRLVVAGVVSYLLSPVAWLGRALIAQLLLDPGPATFALDLPIWVVAVVLAGRSVSLREVPAQRRPYQMT